MKTLEGFISIFVLIYKGWTGGEDDSPYGEWLKDNGYEL